MAKSKKPKVKSLKKMVPAQKKIWTAALRSGKFKQGRGALVVKTTEGSKHCCLGVAQCVLGERPPRQGESLLREGRFGLSKTLQQTLASANDGQNAKLTFEKLGVSPPRLNSRGRATFTSIANWVDKNL